MDSIFSDSASIVKREIPRINGSAAAFIALVVVLVIIILVSCSAVIYILREDLASDAEALTRGNRGRYQISGSHENARSSRNWLLRTLRVPGSRQRTPKLRSDKSRNIVGRPGQGWVQTGNGTDSDFDSSDDLPSGNRNPTITSTKMRMVDYDSSSVATPRSSNVGSIPHVSRVYSSTSDAASSVPLDPHGLRSFSYADQSSLSAHGIIPSIQSQLYSPPSSISLSPIALGSSRTALASPESMERSLSNDSIDYGGGPFSTPSGSHPSVRTFEGGTKFIEAL